MEELPFRLTGWTGKEFWDEFKDLPSGAESEVEDDAENDDFDVDTLLSPNDLTLEFDEHIPPTNDDFSTDDSDSEIPLSDLRKQLLPTAIPIWSRTAFVSSTPSFVAHSGVKDIVRNIQDTTPYKFFYLRLRKK
jgi:hypothetical protein